MSAHKVFTWSAIAALVVSFHAGGASRRRAVGRTPPAVTPPSENLEVDYTFGVEFENVDGKAVLLDYIRPRTNRLIPALIAIHGGGFVTGDRSGPLSSIEPFARHGYFAASIDYRLAKSARFPAQIEDVKAAIRFLRLHAVEYGIDSERIGVWGISSGGMLANLAGTAGDYDAWNHSGGSEGYSSRVVAVADWFGRADLVAYGGCDDLSLLIGCTLQQCPDLCRAASAVTYVSDDDPPFLIQDAPTSATSSDSIELDTKLRAQGVRSELHLDYGEGGKGCAAGTTVEQCYEQAVQHTRDFFDSVLMPR